MQLERVLGLAAIPHNFAAKKVCKSELEEAKSIGIDSLLRYKNLYGKMSVAFWCQRAKVPFHTLHKPIGVVVKRHLHVALTSYKLALDIF